ncbi:PREDICTED: piggyBac transposable element-derived protein 4-like [Cyphomyrmex costatus]|uniref:piggyBac transposable element-derived protein 4-like n=1 Tax=Cyphomyrmex costatus TaxID=456900 RepID=UPI0008523D4A|nr:PREDICTED: piggyBac transposable element-derived protein 4-like [Cyphomyrmex costatus]
MSTSSRKKLRTPSPTSSEDSMSDLDITDDEYFMEEIADTDEENNSSSSSAESAEQEDFEDVDSDDIPLSARIDQLKKVLTFNENVEFEPLIHPFADPYSGLKVESGLDGNSSFMDIFKAFVPEEFVEMCAVQSNLYKEKKLVDLRQAKKLKKNSRLNKCNDITMDEIYTIQAMFILMGITKKPTIEMYWSKDPMIETPFFSKCMPLINSKRPVIDHFNDRFQNIYRPAKNICIDESLMKWQGRLSFKQFNRNKRARFGIKLYETCDSKNGYVYNFKIYVGKESNDSNQKSALGVSGNVVLGDLGGQGRTLYVDNWYSSPWLFQKLHNEKTNVCGIVRANRKHLPKVDKKKFEKGEMKTFSSSLMTYVVWKDKKLVTMLSTKHSPEMITTDKVDQRTKMHVQKPNLVLDYNNNMGGVDLCDQCITPYDIMRKSKKWQLARELLENYSYKDVTACERRYSKVNPVRFIVPHYPARIGSDKSVRKRCSICCRNGKTQLVSTMCRDCNNIPLCVIPCFEKFHTNQT